MGRNDRQEPGRPSTGAAKRRQRHQRPGGPACPEPAATLERPFPAAEHSTYLQTRPDAAPSVEQLRRERAERSLSRLLGAWASAQPLVHLVEQELISLQAEGLHRLDELVTARLRYVVSALWEHGWQPFDLLHVVAQVKPAAGAAASQP